MTTNEPPAANVVDLDDHRPHTAKYVACMACGHDWVAVSPAGTALLECSKCGAMAGEPVAIHDCEWFRRFMAGLRPLRGKAFKADQTKRTLVVMNAGRTGLSCRVSRALVRLSPPTASSPSRVPASRPPG